MNVVLYTSIASGVQPVNTTYPLPVAGTVASDAADSGNPVKVGGVYNLTDISLDDGDRGDLQLTAAGRLKVDTGTIAVTVGSVDGDVAHDAADSGDPLKIGGVAYAFDGTAPQTAVAEGDRVNFIADLQGRQYVETAHPNFWKETSHWHTAQTDTPVVVAPGSGLYLYITDIVVSNGGTAGQIKFVENTDTAVDIISWIYFAAYGGAVMNFRTPLRLSTNVNFGISSFGVAQHSVTIVGYTA